MCLFNLTRGKYNLIGHMWQLYNIKLIIQGLEKCTIFIKISKQKAS